MITSFFKTVDSKKKKLGISLKRILAKDNAWFLCLSASVLDDPQHSATSSQTDVKKRKTTPPRQSTSCSESLRSQGDSGDHKEIDGNTNKFAQEESLSAAAAAASCEVPEKPSFQTLEVLVPADWVDRIGSEFRKPYWLKLKSALHHEEQIGKKIFPPMSLIFNAFSLTPWDEVRVVIIGQDPYHDHGQAHGLCFSVPKGVSVPPSLKNVFKEIKNDYPNFQIPNHGYLESWAKQGVLLLNTSLTVRAHEANSHKDFGFQTFTSAVIDQINQHKSNVVFILWGGQAQAKGAKINHQKHMVLKSPHPSGLSAHKSSPEFPHGFFNNHHFLKCNQYLRDHGLTEIDWSSISK